MTGLKMTGLKMTGLKMSWVENDMGAKKPGVEACPLPAARTSGPIF
jgi:hypothetical protein